MADSRIFLDTDNSRIHIEYAGIERLDAVMRIMERSFSSEYGESWSKQQCLSMLSLPSTKLVLAGFRDDRNINPTNSACAFAILRAAAQEQELLMLAVDPDCQNGGVGSILLKHIVTEAVDAGICAIFLEVRENNPAQKLYTAQGFKKIGRRSSYYTGHHKKKFDAITYKKSL